MRRVKPIFRIQFLGLCILVGLGVLLLRLWWVQVARGYEWTARVQSSSEATVRIPSIRGEIRDRNGVPLVQNRASYEVDFYLPEMVKGYRQRYGRPPEAQYRATISGMQKDLKEPDIVRIVNNGIVPRLQDLDLAHDYNANQLQKHYRNNTEVPYSYIKDIDFATMAKFSEHDVGLPGVDIAIKPVRSYVYGALAAHLLGYVGAPGDTNVDDAKKYTFYQGDPEGKANIEKTMDEYLRGQPGIRVLRRNAKGTIDGLIRDEPAKQGANVYLTLDARIQAVAEEALRAIPRGAVVVVSPNNGDVLAIASVPSFDPNTFIPSIKAKDWKALQKDPGDPLVNRAISALPPGSTFKVVTSLAGLRKNLANARFNCSVGHSVDRLHRENARPGRRIWHSSNRGAGRQYARPRMDANSSSAGTLVAGANRQRLDWPGLHARFATATGDGLCRDRQRRHLSLSAICRSGAEPGWHTCAR